MKKFIAEKPVNIPNYYLWLETGETATVVKHLIGDLSQGYDLLLIERDRDKQQIEVQRHVLLEFGYFP